MSALTLAAVLQNPDDDDARRAHARALGDDPRGRFIEVQLLLAGAVNPAARRALIAEEAALLRAHVAGWAAPATTILRRSSQFMFSRGFIDSVREDAGFKGFVDALPRLLAVEPVRRLELTGVSATTLTTLLAQATVGRLRALSLHGPTAGAVAALAASPQLAALLELTLHGAGLGDDEAVALLASPFFKATRIGLGRNALGARTLAALPSALPVEALFLPDNRVDDAGLAVLLQHPVAARLRLLSLSRNPLTDEGARLLLRADVLPELARLDLSGVAFGDEAREALLGRFGRRVHLDVDGGRPRRPEEPLIELSGAVPVIRGTASWVAAWAAAVAVARFGVDLFLMENWARPEGAPCARCRSDKDAFVVDVDGHHVVDCPSCRGGGVTLGPARPWSDFNENGEENPVALLLQRVAPDRRPDVQRTLLDAAGCAAAADLIAEVEDAIEARWQDTTTSAIAALQATWAARAKLLLRRT